MSEKTMLAAVYFGPNDLRVEQRSIPDIGPGEALLEVESASICGTDLRILHGGHRMFPVGTVRIPGHEVVGRIAKIGEGVQAVDVGDRVFMAPNIGCGHCRQCVSGNTNLCPNFAAIGVTIDGAFAEYMRIPRAAIEQGNLISIDDSIDSAVAALIEPFACVLRGQDALHIQRGEIVLIIGAGPIGIMHLLLARFHGARKVIVSEMIPDRLKVAEKLGADRVVNPESEDLKAVIMDESDGEGADVIIIAAPSSMAQEASLELAAVGGRINFFGGLSRDHPTIKLNSNLVHYRELVITGTTGSSTSNCRQAAEIITSGKVDLSPIVHERIPLSQAREAFMMAEDRNSLKIVIQPAKE
jgi:L-iditol 2-dehydrogenase